MSYTGDAIRGVGTARETFITCGRSYVGTQEISIHPSLSAGDRRSNARQVQRALGDDRRLRREGPHPLDVPTEEQGLALSALDSGRWKVDPGTVELIPVGDGPTPGQPVGLVGELRARDWIAPSGEVTLVGRDALTRWLGQSKPS